MVSRQLPGEDGPLDMRYGGEPITADEALGVARRLARKELAVGRRNTKLVVPEELPPVTIAKTSHIFRLPPRSVAYARARAEMEGTTLSAIVEEALDAYGRGVPGSRITYTPPRR